MIEDEVEVDVDVDVEVEVEVEVEPAEMVVVAPRFRIRERFDLPEDLDPRLVMLPAPDSRRAESFRKLRDSLLAKALPRILAVTSVGPGEGKTTCSVNLALALAERSATDVLVIDGDLRDSSLGQMFGIDAKTPLPWWATPAQLAPYSVIEVKPGFFVATTISEKGQPRPRLDPRWFELVVEHLGGTIFDHVIIDTADLESAPSARQIVAMAQGALLVVKSGATTARALRQTVEDLGEHRTVGVALMEV